LIVVEVDLNSTAAAAKSRPQRLDFTYYAPSARRRIFFNVGNILRKCRTCLKGVIAAADIVIGAALEIEFLQGYLIESRGLLQNAQRDILSF
jgi:hypothetical protein